MKAEWASENRRQVGGNGGSSVEGRVRALDTVDSCGYPFYSRVSTLKSKESLGFDANVLEILRQLEQQSLTDPLKGSV